MHSREMLGGDELGFEFARAFTAKEFPRVGELLPPEVDFRGLTPSTQ